MKHLSKLVVLLSFLFLSALLIFPANGNAQSLAEMEAMRAVMPNSPDAPPAYTKLAQQNSDEWSWLSSQAFLLYKSFVSSQDGSRCTFHPSCSEFAIQSVKQKGLLIGSLRSFDRLIRCNGLNPTLYPRDPNRDVLLDPVH